MKIIGKARSNFTGRDGAEIQGQNFYATYPLSGDGSQGLGCTLYKVLHHRHSFGPGRLRPEVGR